MRHSARDHGSILSACHALAQTKYMARHDAVVKVLFFQILFDPGLIDTVPPWYSPIKPQPIYETAETQAYWDVPVYGEFQELRANRVDARIVNNQHKQVTAVEMSCPSGSATVTRRRQRREFPFPLSFSIAPDGAKFCLTKILGSVTNCSISLASIRLL